MASGDPVCSCIGDAPGNLVFSAVTVGHVFENQAVNEMVVNVYGNQATAGRIGDPEEEKSIQISARPSAGQLKNVYENSIRTSDRGYCIQKGMR